MSLSMFNKILIANRGEIACRVIRTARRLGIKTVAVFSDADRHAMHVTMADEAVFIGAAPSRDSYLKGDAILDAALKTGAQAIHPGYGFLSENADFRRACDAAGVVFIGPPAAAIASMGSKAAAKQIMQAAGVPLVPGFHDSSPTAQQLHAAARAIGYPVLLKAVAGGGGKGMRVVLDDEHFVEALAAAQREAANSFGNDEMLVEKYLTQPRHVEIQVFLDEQGNGVYLFERDCSVQRRHQKVIEEAPAPGVSEKLRQAMGEAALRAAQAINYTGAGTVEFLLDSDGAFYFMEMNTRLQVEHPVTEMITGQDLVEWQLLVAAGHRLPLDQQALKIHGHAFEARLYAEDPEHDFLPQTGRIHHLQPPLETPFVRVDTGVSQGDEISVYYDPMIAKLIVWGDNRDLALTRLCHALREYRISGVKTNLDFLYRIAIAEPFRQGDIDTRFIERHDSLLFSAPRDHHTNACLAALSLLLSRENVSAAVGHLEANSPWQLNDNWRLNAPHEETLCLDVDGDTVDVAVARHLDHAGLYWHLCVAGQSMVARGRYHPDALSHAASLRLELDGHQFDAHISHHAGQYQLYTGWGCVNFAVRRVDVASSQNHGSHFVAPMNGTVVAHLVSAGDEVDAGQGVLVMEAMKMEYTLRAEVAGTVEAFHAAPGSLVDGGIELVSFTPKAKVD